MAIAVGTLTGRDGETADVRILASIATVLIAAVQSVQNRVPIIHDLSMYRCECQCRCTVYQCY